jgi:hypothetical protein
MWLYIFVVPLVVVMIIGGLLAGGIFTIVFLPIAVIIVAAAVIYTMWAQSTDRENIPGERERVKPLPHTGHRNTAAAPSTPDQLVDARRGEQ